MLLLRLCPVRIVVHLLDTLDLYSPDCLKRQIFKFNCIILALQCLYLQESILILLPPIASKPIHRNWGPKFQFDLLVLSPMIIVRQQHRPPYDCCFKSFNFSCFIWTSLIFLTSLKTWWNVFRISWWTKTAAVRSPKLSAACWINWPRVSLSRGMFRGPFA